MVSVVSGADNSVTIILFLRVTNFPPRRRKGAEEMPSDFNGKSLRTIFELYLSPSLVNGIRCLRVCNLNTLTLKHFNTLLGADRY